MCLPRLPMWSSGGLFGIAYIICFVLYRIFALLCFLTLNICFQLLKNFASCMCFRDFCVLLSSVVILACSDCLFFVVFPFLLVLPYFPIGDIVSCVLVFWDCEGNILLVLGVFFFVILPSFPHFPFLLFLSIFVYTIFLVLLCRLAFLLCHMLCVIQFLVL